MKKIFKIILVIFILAGCSEKLVSEKDYTDLNPYAEPIQKNLSNAKIINLTSEKFNLNLTPKAEYKIAAKISKKKRYRFDLSSAISPYDLVLVWGDLVKDDINRYIKYWQSGRWYFYKYKNELPIQPSYIISHSANNHIIPANNNIFKILKKINEGDIIELSGYLVYIDGEVNGNKFIWNSSLTREDSGDGACEVFYVTKVKVNYDVYK